MLSGVQGTAQRIHEETFAAEQEGEAVRATEQILTLSITGRNVTKKGEERSVRVAYFRFFLDTFPL